MSVICKESFHGKDGRLIVEDRIWKSKLPKAFLEAGKQMGFDIVDINGSNQTGIVFLYNLFFSTIMCEEACVVVLHAKIFYCSFCFVYIGFTFPQVTTRDGVRWSSYSAFLKDARFRPNLKIVTHARVEKILIDSESKQAYGVQYIRHGRKVTVLSGKEIVLSAGTIGSATILMLSGIGKKEDLERLGVNIFLAFQNLHFAKLTNKF